MQEKLIIAASILTANFLKLKDTLDQLKKSGIKKIHFDVMDNHFVPNISFGPKILSDINRYAQENDMTIDCHLMINFDPEGNISNKIAPYALDAVENIAIHYEAVTTKQLTNFLNLKTTFKKGLAISPKTNIEEIMPFLKNLDLLLIMSVNPGFGSQTFIEKSYEKISEVKQFCSLNNLLITIAVDGGINEETGFACIKAGANYLVSGSFLLQDEPEKQIKRLLNEK